MILTVDQIRLKIRARGVLLGSRGMDLVASGWDRQVSGRPFPHFGSDPAPAKLNALMPTLLTVC